MKIAIPTNDGLTVSPDFGQAKGFLVLTSEFGAITGEELRWNKLSDILCSKDGYLAPITDCEVVMVNRIGTTFSGLVGDLKKTIVHTEDAIITNAYLHYVDTTQRKDSDTCCCP